MHPQFLCLAGWIEQIRLNNPGIVLGDGKKYREALACYFLAVDICTQIEYPNLEATESNLKKLEEELGKKEFEKLAAEVAPRMEEIVRKMLEGTSEWNIASRGGIKCVMNSPIDILEIALFTITTDKIYKLFRCPVFFLPYEIPVQTYKILNSIFFHDRQLL